MSLNPLFKGIGCAYQGNTVGILLVLWKQFWPDALPAATNNSYRCQREFNLCSVQTELFSWSFPDVAPAAHDYLN